MKKLKKPNLRKLHQGGLPMVLLALFLALMIVVVVIVDSLESTYGWRLDYSFNGITTQSETTLTVLAQLDKSVHIYAIYNTGEEDLPLFELLNRYTTQNELVTWEQADVTLNPSLVVKFQGDAENTLQTDSLVVYCEETDRYKIVSGSNFVSLSYNTESGSYEYSGLNYEKQITEAIVYVTRESIPSVMILTGHGEYDADSLAFFTYYLTSNNFNLSEVNLLNGDTLDPDGLLVILSPVKDLKDHELDAMMAFVEGGGNLFITCDVTDDLSKMSNYLSLLRLYGFNPLDGMVVAGADENGTYYNVRYALIPYMQSTGATSALVDGSQDTLLLALCRAFETPDPTLTDKNLTNEVVLYSGHSAYLHPFDANTTSYEQDDDDPLGPFVLGLTGSRVMDSGDISRAFIVGNTTFLTESDFYAITDNGAFILKMFQYLLDQETISLDIAAKAAVRPGLSVGGQTLGIILIVSIPMFVIIAAILILLPRRHR